VAVPYHHPVVAGLLASPTCRSGGTNLGGAVRSATSIALIVLLVAIIVAAVVQLSRAAGL
jgi:hypothetical protein